jgi:predicted metal-dependent HD superfamily phosphohydrolase
VKRGERLTLDERISRLEEIVSRMRRVKSGDPVMAEDHNLLVDFCLEAIAAVRELYTLFKLKTRKVYFYVEELIEVAEFRARFLTKVKSMDVVRPEHHNTVIDVMKPLEEALRALDEALE